VERATDFARSEFGTGRREALQDGNERAKEVVVEYKTARVRDSEEESGLVDKTDVLVTVSTGVCSYATGE